VNKTACAALSVLLITIAVSCKPPSSDQSPAGDPAIATGKRWRLDKEMIAADNEQDYALGIEALRTLDAFGTMRVSQLFYHHQLVMIPAGTLVAETDSAAGPPPVAPDEKAAADSKHGKKVRVLDGPETGHTLWLYPESAEKMGFTPATPAP
jgi:hypothetical protein